MPSQIVVRRKVGAALRSLQKLHIPFQGPFVTPQKNCIYVVDGCILTVPEIIALCGDGKQQAENRPKLLLDLKRLQARQALGGSANE